MDDLRARAARWAAEDPDPSTRAEIETLLAAHDLAKTDLADRFAGELEFGTAGLRGVIAAGPNRMNRAVVLRAACGLARYLLDASASGLGNDDVKERGVVIGFDGRRLSTRFAEDTAEVLAAHGIVAHLFGDTVPTPTTAFAIAELRAVAGVMVTASHNPPEYNGYKVYWTNAAQIIPPVDKGIARAIAACPAAKDVPRMPVAEAKGKGLVRVVPAAVEAAYLERVRALAVHPPAGRERPMPIVYTPMHGVGGKLAALAFASGGFTNVSVVPEQAAPDGAFPTVAFPNPEEKGAMDLAFALAQRTKAELVLANDPDADRLAVAVPAPPELRTASGYVQLTGNQVGVLLGHYLLTESSPARAARVARAGEKRCVLASNVSSPMLGVIARALGVHYEETLTGFKWIANRAMELEKEGMTFVFGYEEALGYTVGDVVRDKDGISAAVLFAELAWRAREAGTTVLARLAGLYRTYGLFVSGQVNLTKKGADGAQAIRAMMGRLRVAPPRSVAGRAVVAITDLESGVRTELASGKTMTLGLPKSNVLAFEIEGGHRIIARPSGTEPKAKFYFDIREAMLAGESLAAAEARAEATMRALQVDFEAALS
jgi:phosphomannomutase